MNRLFSVFTIIILLLCGACGFLLYQNGNLHDQIGVRKDELSECQSQSVQYENQINAVENQKDILKNQVNQLNQLTTIKNSSIVVRVTNFTTSGMSPMVGVLMESDANITIQNLGTNNLEGLTLAMVHIGDDPAASALNQQSFKIESLEAGEERTVNTNVYWALGAGIRVMISIKLDEIILCEYRTY
jgi:hypothetical protein